MRYCEGDGALGGALLDGLASGVRILVERSALFFGTWNIRRVVGSIGHPTGSGGLIGEVSFFGVVNGCIIGEGTSSSSLWEYLSGEPWISNGGGFLLDSID
uniref:Uncharacterized protein n=1 Tax=Cannabis sativa TaxID=3483 RepID=A0A803Q037_CANSA